MLRRIYSIFFYLLLPFIIIRFYLRSLRSKAYRKRLGERFACFEKPVKNKGIWIHAVSLGEVIAATPLIKALQQEYPNKIIIVTTITPTGSQRVQEIFAKHVFHVYLPLDYPGAVKRFLRKINPCLGIIVETELWPNLLFYARKASIPLILANGRLSERSAKRYELIKSLTKKLLNYLTYIAAQTEYDARRYIRLGMPVQQITVTGNIKFDVRLPLDLSEKAAGLRRQLGEERLVWIAASTHEGEEEQILQAFSEIRQAFPQCLLLLVPRHPERFSKVASLCKKQGYEVIFRTENKACSEDTSVFLGNTMGELLLFYACADVAFVGGSLVPVGGHNLLEPAALGLPAVTGPHMHNFMKITELLNEANGLRQVANTYELTEIIKVLLVDKLLRQQIGENAMQVVLQNRGALEKHLKLINAILNINK